MFYDAKFDEAVYVLHAFQKSAQKTPKQQAAELLGVGQPRISDLVRGKWVKFSIDLA